MLPKDLVMGIHLASFLEYRLFDYLRAQHNISKCAIRRQLQSVAKAIAK